MPAYPAEKTKSMAQIQVVSFSEVGNDTARAQEEQVVLSAIHRNSQHMTPMQSGRYAVSASPFAWVFPLC